MDFTNIILVIMSISSLLLSTNVMPTTRSVHPFIQCSNSCSIKGKDNPTLCVETIIPYFQGIFDLIVALETEFETALNQSLKISNVIAQALFHPSNKSTSALNICKSQYKNIVDTINETAELLNQQNIVDAYYKFSTIMQDTSSCEEVIVESDEVET
ncbi:hypothetical protein Lal_00017545 [Lupinus albus]|nr:hypothetical protein Lal_00017545 [Lupinus albus]